MRAAVDFEVYGCVGWEGLLEGAVDVDEELVVAGGRVSGIGVGIW